MVGLRDVPVINVASRIGRSPILRRARLAFASFTSLRLRDKPKPHYSSLLDSAPLWPRTVSGSSTRSPLYLRSNDCSYPPFADLLFGAVTQFRSSRIDHLAAAIAVKNRPTAIAMYFPRRLCGIELHLCNFITHTSLTTATHRADISEYYVVISGIETAGPASCLSMLNGGNYRRLNDVTVKLARRHSRIFRRRERSVAASRIHRGRIYLSRLRYNRRIKMAHRGVTLESLVVAKGTSRTQRTDLFVAAGIIGRRNPYKLHRSIVSRYLTHARRRFNARRESRSRESDDHIFRRANATCHAKCEKCTKLHLGATGVASPRQSATVVAPGARECWADRNLARLYAFPASIFRRVVRMIDVGSTAAMNERPRREEEEEEEAQGGVERRRSNHEGADNPREEPERRRRPGRGIGHQRNNFANNVATWQIQLRCCASGSGLVGLPVPLFAHSQRCRPGPSVTDIIRPSSDLSATLKHDIHSQETVARGNIIIDGGMGPPDQIARRGKAGRVSMCRAKASHNRPGPRGILLPVPRNKNFTHTVYFGESVWIPATGNTSHIPYQTGTAAWLQAVTYLRGQAGKRDQDRLTERERTKRIHSSGSGKRVDLAPPVSVSTRIPRGENNDGEAGGEDAGLLNTQTGEGEREAREREIEIEMLRNRKTGIRGGSPILGKPRVQCQNRIPRERPTFWRIIVSLIIRLNSRHFDELLLTMGAAMRSVYLKISRFQSKGGWGGLICSVCARASAANGFISATESRGNQVMELSLCANVMYEENCTPVELLQLFQDINVNHARGSRVGCAICDLASATMFIRATRGTETSSNGHESAYTFLSARRRLEVSTWSRVISRANRTGSVHLERSRSRSCRCCHMAARRRVLRAWRAFRGGTCVVGCSLGSPSAVGCQDCQDEWERGVVARLGSAGFASHRRRLASGLPHGLVLAPGAQGSLCGGALTMERDSSRGAEYEATWYSTGGWEREEERERLLVRGREKGEESETEKEKEARLLPQHPPKRAERQERDTSWECLPAAPTRLPDAGLAAVQGSSEHAHRKIECVKPRYQRRERPEQSKVEFSSLDPPRRMSRLQQSRVARCKLERGGGAVVSCVSCRERKLETTAGMMKEEVERYPTFIGMLRIAGLLAFRLVGRPEERTRIEEVDRGERRNRGRKSEEERERRLVVKGERGERCVRGDESQVAVAGGDMVVVVVVVVV
ncbi:hypothetical protein DBV15_01445 [Temnothorax longispinosus]|uniref:Uncharacterized protein n=1 Tax=Temnothorax longispinosus TaxID=300112 RepID=A0A4S2KUT5_9HYME|nr:hypothetical protein DBV15_01445 [Temnothorax longispinosus]